MHIHLPIIFCSFQYTQGMHFSSQGLASPLPLAFVARGAESSEARMAAKASHEKREKQAAKVPL